MKLNCKNTCVFAIAAILNTGVQAAVGLENVCVYYNAVSSTTVGFKVAARLSIWKGSTQCGTLTVDPGATACYNYAQSATCNTAATAATTVVAEPFM